MHAIDLIFGGGRPSRPPFFERDDQSEATNKFVDGVIDDGDGHVSFWGEGASRRASR